MSNDPGNLSQTQPIPGPGETQPIETPDSHSPAETQPVRPDSPAANPGVTQPIEADFNPAETQPSPSPARIYPHGSVARARAMERAAIRRKAVPQSAAIHRQPQDPTTHPVRTGPARTGPPPVSGGPPAQSARSLGGRPNTRLLLWGLFLLGWLGIGGTTGALAGYRASLANQQARVTEQAVVAISEQYYLAVQDMQAGRYEHAQQRFEYILAIDPAFPGAAEGLGQAKAILYATATPTATPTDTPPPTETPTPSPSPTPDTRPLEELLDGARASLSAGDWTAAIETLSALRSNDPAYAVAEVDGLLFIALRLRGLDRILNQRDLEGGVYDLTLAERFGPLDSEAVWARDMVRIYMYGSAFWEAYPEQAVYYFGQVASAAPYLTDASGWTSTSRYWASLIHYGDALAAADDWCNAQAQYELALTWRVEEELQAKAEEAAYNCSPPTATPTETPIPSETPTATIPPPAPPTETQGPPPPATDSPPPTEPPPSGETPTPTPTPTQEGGIPTSKAPN